MMRAFLVFLTLTFIPLSSNASNAKQLLDLSKYRGKVVYLDFWASWCVPCRKSFPWMNKIRAEYSKSQLAIVTVNLDKERHLAKDFLKKYPATFSVIYDSEGVLASKYKIQGMPSSILFDKKGKAITAHSGFFEKKIAQYEKEINQAVRRKAEYLR